MNERMSWRRRGDAYRDARNWSEAVHAYKRYLSIVPADYAIWIQYGHALKETGHLRAALLAYERSKELNPSDPDRDIHMSDLEQRVSDKGGIIPMAPPVDKAPSL